MATGGTRIVQWGGSGGEPLGVALRGQLESWRKRKACAAFAGFKQNDRSHTNNLCVRTRLAVTALVTSSVQRFCRAKTKI